MSSLVTRQTIVLEDTVGLPIYGGIFYILLLAF